MNIIVQKYGGSSVADKEKMEIVCNNIIQYIDNQYPLVVVVSAQGKTTDTLIKQAKDYCVQSQSKREMDLLLSTGEIQSVCYLTMMLNEKGYKAIGLTGEQAGIISDSEFGNAKIDMIYQENILSYLEQGYIPVIAGFQATDRLGNITTLGRGGSDLTAVALASILKAKRCEIYTDVEGIFSSDPRVIKKSKLLKNISYNEMLEAASAGAKVLHNRCVSLAKKNHVNLVVKKTSLTELEGTLIQEESLEKSGVTFISHLDHLSKICIVGDLLLQNRDVLNTIASLAKENNYTIYMLSISELSIHIVVSSDIAIEFCNLISNILLN